MPTTPYTDNHTCFLETAVPETVKEFSGRDALLRVRNRNCRMDAEHRVPTRSDPPTGFFHGPVC